MMRTIPIARRGGKLENPWRVGCVILKRMNWKLTRIRNGGQSNPRSAAACGVLAVMLVGFAGLLAAPGQATSGQATSTEGSPLGVAPKEWARDAAMNELKVLNYGRSYLRYREHTNDEKGNHLREVIESKDGPVARLLMKEGRPLTPQEDKWEHDRLQAMLDSPAAYAKHVKGDVSGKKMGSDLIKLTPDAMLYSYTPGQPQRLDRVLQADDLPEIVIDYKPNPKWTAPTISSDALTGVEGRVWIDPKTHYLTRMEADIFRPVNFGLFLARIYPGGKLTFEQTRMGERRWIFSKFTEKITLRVLIKTIKEDTDIEAWGFSVVPEMSYQDAIKMLWAMPLPK